jgi:hypothetical protein
MKYSLKVSVNTTVHIRRTSVTCQIDECIYNPKGRYKHNKVLFPKGQGTLFFLGEKVRELNIAKNQNFHEQQKLRILCQ